MKMIRTRITSAPLTIVRDEEGLLLPFNDEVIRLLDLHEGDVVKATVVRKALVLSNLAHPEKQLTLTV